MHKHALSSEYFRFRKYSILAPSALSSLSISVIGFVAASDVISDQMKVDDAGMREFLILLVSCLGFVVLTLTILGTGLDYVTRVAAHEAAAEDLMGLCDEVRMYRMERAMDERANEEGEAMKDEIDGTDVSDDETSALVRAAGEDRIMLRSGTVGKKTRRPKRVHGQNAQSTSNIADDKVRRARERQDLSRDAIAFHRYHAELRQICRGCRSDVPPRIAEFFTVMENRVELMSLSRLGVEEESRMRKNQIVRLCANEIHNDVSNFVLWPIFTPPVDRTIEIALKRVGQLLNMNYRARRRCKLIPCFPVPLCCKKAKSDNVFVIINEGIDQREIDLMQSERIELVRMENERRERRNSMPEQVLDTNDTFYVDDDGRGGSTADPRGYRNPPRASSDERSRHTRNPDGSVYAPSGVSAKDSQSPSLGVVCSSRSRGRAGRIYLQERNEYASEVNDVESRGETRVKKSKKNSNKSKERSMKNKYGKVDRSEYDEVEGEEYGQVKYDEEYRTVYSENTIASQKDDTDLLEEGGGNGTAYSEKYYAASDYEHSDSTLVEKFEAMKDEFRGAFGLFEGRGSTAR
ncbi:hypothetical protein ACHAW5_005819 [Stephanodiscus triporus]|uniref:Uncharacterized protein n=1 Tax=Stephanodiscus triporus TaxID=2934178 RepID=A0ABD3PX59_9STRA